MSPDDDAAAFSTDDEFVPGVPEVNDGECTAAVPFGEINDDEVAERAVVIARDLASLPATAVRWTKYSLNNWYRQAGPLFDASLGYEFFGFGLPEAREGLAALKEKRPPDFRAAEDAQEGSR